MDDERTILIELLDEPITPTPSNARKRVEDFFNNEVNRMVAYENETDWSDIAQ